MKARPLALIAKVLGRKYDITVTIAGQIACTTGKEITIPVVSGDHAEALAHGYIDHEAAHVRYTDFSVQLMDNFAGDLLNILEDVRIEQAIGWEYPGCIANLRELTRILVEQHGAFRPDPSHPSQSILSWIMALTRIAVLNHDSMRQTRDSAEPLVRQILGEQFNQAVQLLDRTGTLRSTRETAALRDELMKLIRNAAKPMQTNGHSQTSQSASGSNGNSGQGNQDGQSQQKNATDTNGGQQAKDGGKQQAPSQPSTKSDNSTSSGQQTPGQSGASLETARQAISEALSGKSIGSYGNVGEKLAELLCQNATESSFNGSGAAAPRLPTAQPLRNASGYDDISALRVHTAALRARLQGLVQASKQKRSTPASVGHRLDSRVLTRLRVGDTRVFNRKEEKRAVNTAVCMLLDSSGSMGNSTLLNKMGIASRACFVASEALYSIPGVRTAIATFKGFDNRVFPMVDFGEKPDHSRFNITGSGGTRLGHALWWAWGELCLRRETRKICIAFSDGDTGDGPVTQAAIKRMRESGIEVIGIGIQDTSIKRYLPDNHRIIKNLDQFTPALLELLREKLVA
ncbi:von Willebrand factor type A domain protein [Geobacter sp. OR-1]|uniref:VWA domain-containing protein n=1 Tax=Geobacter sp. OR-1 TaxID=1266765 RepID=UPI0005429CA9|nr:VWA domain-containing protein [Geobacter sp. OR-1]GAM08366.1 von Willebrand factor type A domain protein [Geobacter sp. OR-1]